MSYKKVVVSFLLILVLSVATAYAGVIQQTYHFDAPITERNGEFDLVKIEGTSLTSTPGEPILPEQSVMLLLSPGEEVESVQIRTSERVVIPGEYYLEPAQKPYPIHKGPWDEATPPNPEIYRSDNPFPAQKHGEVSTQFLSGHGIGITTIYPVEYIPARGEIAYYPTITVEFTTHSTDKAATSYNRLLRTNEKVNKRLRNLVSNPEVISEYGAMTRDEDEIIYDFLMITRESNLPIVQEYADFKMRSGFRVKLLPNSEIYDQYDGEDKQEKIRNCIIDYYENYGLEYVLLAGDGGGSYSGCPDRKFYCDNGQLQDHLPADLYYAALDGSWNDDGDNKWGEVGEDDLLAEVFVGRIPSDYEEPLQNWINKAIRYQMEPVVDEVETALMVGEDLGWESTGSDYKEEIRLGGTYNGYYTEGFPEYVTVDTLYDVDDGWHWDPFPHLLPKLNGLEGGAHLVNHDGHGFNGYCMKLYTNQVTDNNMTNNGINHTYNIMYTQSCLSGGFDGSCINEVWTTLANGPVAYITNSREGWGQSGGTNGASQRFDRHFFDAIWGEDMYIIGEVQTDSKEDNVAQVTGNQTIRWVYYELNLFGDPTMEIWTEEPTQLYAEHPEEAKMGETSITVTVTDESEFPVSGAKVSCSTDSLFLGTATTNATGVVEIQFNEELDEEGTLHIYVQKHNMIPTTSEIPITMESYIEGVITDGATEEFIAAEVSILETGASTMSRAADGYYRLYIPEAGDYTVVSEFWGYDTYESDLIAVAEDDYVEHNIAMNYLENAGTIEGYVVSALGIVYEGAEVSIMGYPELGTQLTDATGHYEFYPLVPDMQYDLEAYVEGYAPILQSGYVEASSVTQLDFTIPYVEKLELTDGKYAGEGEWQWGIPTEDGGPADAYSGEKVWGTNLSGEYSSGSQYALYTQPYALDLSDEPFMEFYTWYQTSQGWDGGNVQITTDGGSSWEVVVPDSGYPDNSVSGLGGDPGFTGDSGGWMYQRIDLSDYVDQEIQFKFYFGSTMFSGYNGWFIDDISLDGGSFLFVPPLDVERLVQDVNEVILTWDSPDAENITGYKVYRKTDEEISFGAPIAELDNDQFSYTDDVWYDGVYTYGLTTVYEDGESVPIPTPEVVIEGSGVGDGETVDVPAKYGLSQNYPNPFNPTTTIHFAIPNAESVRLSVYDMSGKLVKMLVDEDKEAGYHSVKWNGNDESGNAVGSGVYIYRIEAGEYNQTKRCVMLK